MCIHLAELGGNAVRHDLVLPGDITHLDTECVDIRMVCRYVDNRRCRYVLTSSSTRVTISVSAEVSWSWLLGPGLYLATSRRSPRAYSASTCVDM